MLSFLTNEQLELYFQAFAAYSQTPYLLFVNYILTVRKHHT